MTDAVEYKVDLVFFEDEATGEWGFAPRNSLNLNTPFNAFWSGPGFFHDVFEHYFEDRHSYFCGENAFNIGGEIAAMGHRAYYYWNFGFDELMGNEYQGFTWSVVHTTFGEMEEAITQGYSSFGERLMCGVPVSYGGKSCSYNLDSIIAEHCYLKDMVKIPIEKEYSIWSRYYKRSLTDSKIRRLYTWRYLEAEKIAPYNKENQQTFREFLEHWSRFCRNNKAGDLKDIIEGLEFTITTADEKLSWSAEFTLIDGIKVSHKDFTSVEDLFPVLNEDYERTTEA